LGGAGRDREPAKARSFSLIFLGILGIVVLGRLAMINATGSSAKDLGIAAGLLLLPVALIGTGLWQLGARDRTSPRP
jgi:hypothetical protein